MGKKKKSENLYLLTEDGFAGGYTYHTIDIEDEQLILQANLVFDLKTKTGTKLAKKFLSEMLSTQLTPVIKKIRKKEKGNKIRKETTYKLPEKYMDRFFADDPMRYEYIVYRHFYNGPEKLYTTHNLQEAEERAMQICKSLNIKVTIYRNGELFKTYKTDRSKS